MKKGKIYKIVNRVVNLGIMSRGIKRSNKKWRDVKEIEKGQLT